MNENMGGKIVEICLMKIASKGKNVGLAFYAFFTNENDEPELLMEIAERWIMKHNLIIFSPLAAK